MCSKPLQLITFLHMIDIFAKIFAFYALDTLHNAKLFIKIRSYSYLFLTLYLYIYSRANTHGVTF